MNWNNGSRVLAIGIDAAESTLVRRLIAHDEMPVLKSLLAEGRWLRVESPAHIGSGSVWPTFITGDDPASHGVYGEWAWQPESMGLSRYNGRHLKPFWKALSAEGFRVGVFDVPFAPFTGFTDGFEISEWGPHDLLEGRVQVAPEAISDLITKRVESHPLSQDRLDTAGPRDYGGLKALGSGCAQGVKLRGALAKRLMIETAAHLSVVVFTEIHHSAHYLWHTIAGEHSIYQQEEFRNLAAIEPTLKDIYLEVDRQIGELIEAVGSSATVMVFSLHGMRPAVGVPTLLEPLLCELGYARFADWAMQSWTERASRVFASAKRHTPASLKRLYYKALPPTTTLRLARPTMMRVYDWQKTRAFALPADQHGWVHINLIGREARGAVSPDDYVRTCDELEQMLKSLVTSKGSPIVHEVIRTAAGVTEALRQRLPDLVVHWEDAAFSAPLKIKGATVESAPTGRKFTGRHARDGFCIFKGRNDLCEGETLQARDMHRVIARSLRGD
ncbi:MAG TPA: alkaline phosphatase family protein [Pyrinomonadaceae bacterium]|nr:alkaline phosphatase family protein [Pyrinomonadaceae bacterium]